MGNLRYLAFLDIKISTEGNGLCTNVYCKPTDSHSYLLYSPSHPSHVKNSIPFSKFLRLRRLCSDDSDFYENQKRCASFAINVTILFLLFKRATTVPNKLIDSQHYKRLRKKTLTAFHSLSNFTLTTTRLNLSFLRLVPYIFLQPPLLSFKLDKNIGNCFSEVHFKSTTNLELANAPAFLLFTVANLLFQLSC